MATDQVSDKSVTDDVTSSPKKIGPFTVRRWLVLIGFIVMVLFLMRPILDPYGEKGVHGGKSRRSLSFRP